MQFSKWVLSKLGQNSFWFTIACPFSANLINNSKQHKSAQNLDPAVEHRRRRFNTVEYSKHQVDWSARVCKRATDSYFVPWAVCTNQIITITHKFFLVTGAHSVGLLQTIRDHPSVIHLLHFHPLKPWTSFHSFAHTLACLYLCPERNDKPRNQKDSYMERCRCSCIAPNSPKVGGVHIKHRANQNGCYVDTKFRRQKAISFASCETMLKHDPYPKPKREVDPANFICTISRRLYMNGTISLSSQVSHIHVYIREIL